MKRRFIALLCIWFLAPGLVLLFSVISEAHQKSHGYTGGTLGGLMTIVVIIIGIPLCVVISWFVYPLQVAAYYFGSLAIFALIVYFRKRKRKTAEKPE